MTFTKSFPKEVPGSRLPEWIEITLSDAEETAVEAIAREQHMLLMKECLTDAQQIVQDKTLKDYQTNIVQIAQALFDKRASHVVWHKEERAREKFEKNFK